MAHVHVTVDADTSDAEYRDDTRRSADATEGDTQTRLVAEEVGTLEHACANNTGNYDTVIMFLLVQSRQTTSTLE